MIPEIDPLLTMSDVYFNVNEGISLGLYFVIVGYMVLLSIYFLLIRFRKTKKVYWLYFSGFFAFTAMSRALFVLYDFFMPYILSMQASIGDIDPLLPLSYYRWAQFTGWLAVATLVGLLSTLLFTEESNLHKYLRLLTPVIAVIIAFLWFVLPNELILNLDYIIYRPVEHGGYDVNPGIDVVTASYTFGKGIGLFYINYIFLPIYILLLPATFFYLGVKSVGIIRKSSLLNGMGFLIYYAGRMSMGMLGMFSSRTQLFTPAFIILLGLLLISLANMMMMQN